MSNKTISVYEFSREFFNIHQNQNGIFVSGGYENETGCSNYKVENVSTVPFAIKNAVENHLFRINDNFGNRLLNEVALIAREISDSTDENTTYSVLAVATRLIEDGSRPGVYYRYFWLKGDRFQKTDGICTLLCWWEENNRPKYKIENQGCFLDSQDYVATLYTYDHFKSSLSKEIEPYLSQVKEFPYIFLCDDLSLFAFHYLALYLHQKSENGIPIAWAWKVSSLDRPNSFSLINCVDQSTYSSISKLILPVSISSFIMTSVNSVMKGIKKQVSPSNGGSSIESENKSIISLSKIQILLVAIARSHNPSQEKITELVDYLAANPLDTWDWESATTPIVDNTTLNPPSVSKITAKYYALLVLLNPSKYVKKWLDCLAKYSEYQKISLDFHQLTYQKIKEFKNEEINEKISTQISLEIIELLLDLTNSSLDENYKKQVKWLLTESKKIWNPKVIKYSKVLIKHLCRWENNTPTKTYDSLYRDIEKKLNIINAEKQVNPTFQRPYREYKQIAQFFFQLQKYSLSAFFYQLSENAVPENVYIRSEVDIIPLKKNADNVVTEDNQITQNNKLSWNLLFPIKNQKIGILIGVIIASLFWGMITESGHKSFPDFFNVLNIFFNTNQNTNSIGNNSSSSNGNIAFSQHWHTWINSKKVEDREISKKAIIDLLNQEDKQTILFLKSTFFPTNLDASQPKNLPISSSSLLEDTKFIQTQLQLAGFYRGTINGDFSDDTKTAIQSFQQTVNLEAVGTMDKITWAKLYTYLLEDKSVEIVKQFIITSLINRENYDESKKDISQNLTSCKTKTTLDDFILCIQYWQKEIK